MINLKTFRSKYKLRCNAGLSIFSLKEIVRDLSDIKNAQHKYDFDVFLPTYGKKLQRDLVWTVFQKQQLVISLLMGRVIPKVTIVEFRPETNSEISKREIIDGKQRITALISFIKNEFPIFVDGVDYFFKDLPDEIKFEILNHRIVGDVYYSYGLDFSDPDFISDEMKIEIFERVNFAGTPQDADHILNIKK